MSKIILLDIDGVILRWSTRFSQKYAEEHNIPYDEINTFFKNEFEECSVGKKDLKAALPAYLKKWNWPGTIDEFLSYWFEQQMDVDHDLLKAVQNVRKTGTKVYLASNQEIYRTDYLKNYLELNKNFDGGFFSCEFGVRKENPKFFQKILETLKVEPENLLFFDDDIKNIKTAESVGIESIQYQTLKDFTQAI